MTRMSSIYGELIESAQATAEQIAAEKEEELRRKRSHIIPFSVKRGDSQLITFLNDPSKDNLFWMHKVTRLSKSKKQYSQAIACLGDKCPLCAAKHRRNRYPAWLVINWTNSFSVTDAATGAVKNVAVPAVQLMIRSGLEWEAFSNQAKHLGTLKKRIWEISVVGQKSQTAYQIIDTGKVPSVGPKEQEPVLDEAGNPVIRDGKPVMRFKIRRPDWPAYQTAPQWSPEDFSLYTKRQARPDYEFDITNESHVLEFIAHHLYNTPMNEYREIVREMTNTVSYDERPVEDISYGHREVTAAAEGSENSSEYYEDDSDVPVPKSTKKNEPVSHKGNGRKKQIDRTETESPDDFGW